MAYAENTSVPVERSRAELERTLTRYPGHAMETARVALRDLAEHGFTVKGADHAQ